MGNTALRLTGMTCDLCAQSIETALNDLAGVAARVFYDQGLARIETNGDIALDTLVKTVTAKGYGASPVDDESKGPNGRGGGSLHIVIIGSGSAGFSAAITAAEQGAHVTLIGHGTIGGTCLNVGCVPSKTLIRAVEPLHQARVASRFAGIQAEGTVEDWRAVVAQKDALVSELRQAKYIDVLPGYNGVAYLDGPARLAEHGVAVNGSVIEADKVIITTGSSPALPSIAGMEEVPYLTSTTALELEELPTSMLVVGGGYIGC